MNIMKTLQRLARWLRWTQPPQIDYVRRREEMIRLRKEEGKTLQEIGEIYGVSRERARQIIGNTGVYFRTNWTRQLMKSGKVLLRHWTELRKAPGVRREWQRDWGNHRHEITTGMAGVGHRFEELASQVLKENGIENTPMPNHCKYDIRTENGARVEVTVTNVDVRKMKSQSVYPTFAVTHRVRECDFLFAFIPDEKEGYTYFVIPMSALIHLKTRDARIRIPYPPISGKPSKWHKYHKRIDLIKNYTV